ncbi:hypothetical protein [Brevundimonas naejangsanensis]|uniref:hypothetical protein n=1 Tax=Brevundimonas naejangsanensis TaxID=588932 RepID=UPI00106B443C|nr:hypothetical protein [Brevundimonas naejangsanensis]QBQ49061.1 hypothetical protein E3U41_10430 [Brevundimonas naejangsanensis]
MTDTIDLINRAVAETMTPDFVKAQVATRVEKLVVEAVDAALRSYSDIGKQIKEAVEASLKVNDLNLPSYGLLVTGMIEKQVKDHAGALIDARLAEDIRDLLNIAPAEIRLSAIAEEMIKGQLGGDGYGDVITVIVEHNEYGSTWLYLDEEQHHSDRDKYQCRHSLLLSKDGTISSARIDKRDLKDTEHIGRSWSLGDKIRAYYAAGTRIILDEDAVVTSVGDY